MFISHITRLFALTLFVSSLVPGLQADESGTFTDPRDGKSYATVAIGDQVWMAENFRYEHESSWIYQDKMELGERYGRLYSWQAAVESCPKGWRFPTQEDYDVLIEHLGGRERAAAKLKSSSKWWREGTKSESLFKADPGGARIHFGWYFYQEERAFLWTATEFPDDPERAKGILLDYRFDEVFGKEGFRKETGFSVRYIKK